jgi:glycosyltransferase involved in cell wall biosynthesis
MKTFSVILTTYNSAGTLQRVLDSILQQDGTGSLFAIQLLVIDDESKDKTRDILRQNNVEFLTTDKNSGGPNKGRNMGLAAATGDYICITDHDDVWHPHRLKSVLPHLLSAPIVTSGYTVVNTDTQKTDVRINKQCNAESAIVSFPTDATFKTALSKSHGGQTTYLGSIVYSVDFRHIRFEEDFGVVDFEWIVSLFHQQHSIEVCDTLYTRYVDNSNLSLNPRYRQIDFDISLRTIERYRHEFPHLVRLAFQRIHGSRARYHYYMGEMDKARYFLLRAGFSLKHLLYYLTTFGGSECVKKKFNVFG